MGTDGQHATVASHTPPIFDKSSDELQAFVFGDSVFRRIAPRYLGRRAVRLFHLTAVVLASTVVMASR